VNYSIYQNEIEASDTDNVIEVKCKMNNRKNSIPIDNMIVSLLQIVTVKEELPRSGVIKVKAHVKEVLFC
jgi:uncharacterized NAD(P)/FAD-binding protein YdhS